MALYETQEEIQEVIIDAFDKQTGRGDFLRRFCSWAQASLAAAHSRR